MSISSLARESLRRQLQQVAASTFPVLSDHVIDGVLRKYRVALRAVGPADGQVAAARVEQLFVQLYQRLLEADPALCLSESKSAELAWECHLILIDTTDLHGKVRGV